VGDTTLSALGGRPRRFGVVVAVVAVATETFSVFSPVILSLLENGCVVGVFYNLLEVSLYVKGLPALFFFGQIVCSVTHWKNIPDSHESQGAY
jgi:hypothetical protein